MNKSFFDKEEYTENDLSDLIKNGIEESLNLEYKSAAALGKSDSKKNEIAKDISAFANSSGGIIIYGIEEMNHKPNKFSFVDGNELNKEWLENVIDSNIHPRIQSIQIFPIRVGNQLTNSIYLVKIPESINAPHMSVDKKYYRRFNFKSVPMEEYEIRNLYNRTTEAEMDFKNIWSKDVEKTEINDISKIRKEINVQIKNISNVLEKHCKIEATFRGLDNTGVIITYIRDSNVEQRFSTEKKLILKAYNESPVFPNEEIAILTFVISFDQDKLKEFKQNAILELTLFDSTTTKTTEYDLDKLF